jgi:hypothetical protein
MVRGIAINFIGQNTLNVGIIKKRGDKLVKK